MWELALPEICGHHCLALPWEKPDHCGGWLQFKSTRLAVMCKVMWFSHIDEILCIILALHGYVSAKRDL